MLFIQHGLYINLSSKCITHKNKEREKQRIDHKQDINKRKYKAVRTILTIRDKNHITVNAVHVNESIL